MLKPRTGTVLKVVVNEYIQTAAPVASESVAHKSRLTVSPATIRNEMAELEEEGYISRQHISSGAVPCDKGYRYFVESLEEVPGLPLAVQRRVRHRFGQASRDLEVWARLAATLLAQMTGNLVLVTLPRSGSTRLRHLQLVYLQEFLVLLIIVLQEARLRQQLLPLKESLTPDELTRTANKLNSVFSGLTRGEIGRKAVELTPVEEWVKQSTLVAMKAEEEEETVEHYVDGLRHLLSQPELYASPRVREVAAALEGGILLRLLLAESSEQTGVKVIIGAENREEVLKSFSVALAPYRVTEETMGLMGVLGPTRMDYADTLGELQFFSSFMSELVSGVRGKGP
ncbi:MAG: heat-inducible transcriptional repressor HrcA [Dehalococcoidia bacterium]